MPPFARVLLDRREAGRVQRGQAPRAFVEGSPGSPEVEEDRRAVGADHDVGGLDVAVQVPGRVNQLQPLDDRQDQGEGSGFVQGSRTETFREGLAGNEVHHEVAGAVRFETALHPHDVRVPETREHAPFLAEARETPMEVVRLAVCARRDRVVGTARRPFGGEVLLERHAPSVSLVEGEIRHAEPAAPQHALDAVV